MKILNCVNGAPVSKVKKVVSESLFNPIKKAATTATEIAEDTFVLGSKNDELLNYMYKHLPVGTERKLENFNGRRKISVYRGADYMNKITQKLSDPPLTLIRSMKNVGTSSDPRLVNTAVSVRIPFQKEEIIVRVIDEGPDKDKLFLRVTETGFVEAHKAIYENWDQLRKDNSFKRVLKFMRDKFKK